MKRALCWLALLSACHGEDWLQYRWDDRRVLCSRAVDDLRDDVDWDDVASEIELAREHAAVTLVHAHAPGVTVSHDAIARVLALADATDLAYVTYRELVPGPQRAAIALAFDDDSFAEWAGMRELLAAHGARVTFFITRLHLADPAELAILAQLAADGHAIEAHGALHRDARQYACDHGADRYITDEVAPSIERLRELGYNATSFAYPHGNDHRDVDAALQTHVARVRVSPFSCPH